MKKLYKLASALSIAGLFGLSAAQAQTYCTPSYYWGCSSIAAMAMTEVTVTGGLNGFSNQNSGCSANNYGNFTNLEALANPGDTMSFYMAGGTVYGQAYSIWIDWNNDGDFDDADEDVYIPTTISSSPSTESGTFVVPSNASMGVSLRMRTSAHYYYYAQYNNTHQDPCPTGAYPFYYGETEDYGFKVIPRVQNDAGVTAITSPSNQCNLSDSLKIKLQNLGSNDLASCVINWQITGGASGSTNWSDQNNPIPSRGEREVFVGTTSFTDGDELLVYTTSPNSVLDSFAGNDSIMIDVFESLTGTYTVGGTGADYATIGDAASDVTIRGVCGATVFNIAAGTYNERVTVGNIPGTSMMNTVTFQAESDTALVEIVATQNSDSNYVVGLFEASHTTFNNLTIDGSNGSSYGTAALIQGGMYNSFENSVMLGTQVNTQTAVTMKIAGGMGHSVIGNEINDGYYTMEVSGDDLVIQENDILEAYYYSIFANGGENLDFSHNYVETSRGYIYSARCYINGVTGPSKIIGNKVNQNGYYDAFDFYELSGTANEQPMVANNMVWCSNPGSFTYYGIYCYNCGFVQAVNNSIAMDGNTIYYPFYFYGGANELYNNNVHAMNSLYGGAYISGSFSVTEMDHNNFWTGNTYAYLNGYRTFSNWNSSTGFGANSFQTDPLWTNFDSLRSCNDTLDGAGTPIDGLSYDFDMDDRDPENPDIGADEWLGNDSGSFSAGPDAIVCEGKTVMIGLNTTGVTYVWNTGETTGQIEVSDEGTYTVTATSSCGAVHTDDIVVTDQTPIANFTEEVSFRTANYTNTSSKNDYNWWVIETAPFDTVWSVDLTYVFDDNGPYNITLYAGNDCDTVSKTVTWQTFVGIEEGSLENMISMYPNPVSDQLFIQFGELSDDDVNVVLTNVQGQVVATQKFTDVVNSNEVIDVSSLEEGLYIVKFSTATEVVAKRIIVQ